MKILKITPKNFSQVLKKAANVIKEGKVIVCPTDTVYGLVCDATNKRAVEKVFKIKKRPKEKPIPIFVRNIRMAKSLAQISKEQREFLKKSWPGKLTTVLKRPRLRPSGFGGRRKIKLYGVDKKTIALRIPNYKLVNILLEKLNCPLTGTSANISGKPATGNIKKILRQFKGKKYQPDLIIDAGILPKSKPSTVLDLTVSSPKILRR